MKIGVFYHGRLHWEAGGGTVFQKTLVEEITRVNSRHEIYIFSREVPEYLPRNDSIRFIKVDADKPQRLRRIWKAVKYVFLHGVNAYFDNNIEAPGPLDRAVHAHNIDLLWFISTRTENVTIPYISTVWDLAHRTHPYFPEFSVTGWKWGEREKHHKDLLSRSAIILTGTFAGKEDILKYYQVSEDIVQVVPFPAPQFALFPPLPDEHEDLCKTLPEKYLFYPAQFWPHKNHVGLLLALKIVREKYGLDFNLVFTGSDRGNLRYVQEKVKELGLDENVLFLGFVDPCVLKKLYRNAFALVFPTFLGPDNLPPLEAFALGCPVIASKVSGAEEQLGTAALLFNPGNAEEIASLVKELYDNPVKREGMIRQGFERAQQWTAADYMERAFSVIDAFETVRRCWSSREPYIQK